MPPLQPGCGTCVFAKPDANPDRPDLLHCRRYPPVPLVSVDGKDIVSFFPPMRADGWCGEYSERPPEPARMN
jgi:hypothetical protein